MRLSREESHEINKQEDKGKVLLIERSSKSEHWYWLVVRLKAI